MSNELLGDDFRLYYDSASSYSTPTWVQQISVGDMGFDPGNEQVEIPIRIAFKVYKKGRADWELTFTMNYDPDSTFVTAVRNAITNGTKLHLAIADGPVASENYWHAWWMLSGPLDAALDSNANIEVSGKIHHDRGVSGNELPAFVPAT